MRVATLLSAAAIAVLATAGPALAYAPSAASLSLSNPSDVPARVSAEAKKGQVQLAFAIIKRSTVGEHPYVIVRTDNGRQQPIRNCDTSANCINEPTWMMTTDNVGASPMYYPCKTVGGCRIIGKR